MANPWDNDPVVKPANAPANPWDNDPVVGQVKQVKPETKPESSLLSKAANVFGIQEAALNMGTGLLAKPISDIAGLAATGSEMVSPMGGDPAAFKRHVQDSLTYQPRTTVGKITSEYNPLALVGKGISKVADMSGNTVAGDNPGTARQAAGNFVREAIPQAVGFALPAMKGRLNARLATKEASLAAEQTENASRDANIVAAREQGYVLPPSVAGVKGPLSSFFQAEAGSTKLDYGASMKNQRVTNAKVKKELGLQGDKPISIDALDDLREKYSKVYEDVKAAVPVLKSTKTFKDSLNNPNSYFAEAKAEFPEYFKNAEIDALVKTLSKDQFTSKAAIQLQKKLRADGNVNMKAFDDVGKQSLGEAQLNAAKAIDNLIDENLQMKAPPGVKNFQSKLSSNLAQARKKIAQSYAVQGALNDTTGNISAPNLGRLWEKQGSLTGGLEDVAKMHKAFEKQMRNVDKLPATASENMSNMDVAKGAMLAGMGHGAVGAISTLGRAAVKPVLLSDWYQAMNVKPPTYKPGLAYTLPAELGNNPGWNFTIPKPPQQDK